MNVQLLVRPALKRLAGIFPYLILFTYIAGCIFCLLIDRMSYLINGSILAVPAIIGAFTFVFIKKKDVDLSGSLELFPYRRLISPQFFLAAFMLSVLAFLVTPSNSVIGLFGVVVLYAVIFAQIMSARLRPATVLVEIMLTLAVTIYSYTLRPALYFGTTDLMPHSYMATITYLSGHVIPGELGTYTYFPLYHVFVALSSHVLGLDIDTALFITTGLIFSTTVLFLYYLANSVFRNAQITLLIVLSYAMNSDVIYYGTYMVTRTMAYVGFIILLYLVYSMVEAKPETGYIVTRPAARRVFAVIMVMFVLLTHQVSMPMVIVMIGLVLFLERFTGERRRVSFAFLMVPASLFAGYWLFVAYPFVKDLFPRADLAVYQNIVLTEAVYQGWNFLLSQVDTLFVVFFALIGAIYLIWKQQPGYSIIFGVLGLAAIILNVPSVLTVIFQLVSVLRIDRFAILFLPILAVAVGVGVYVLTRYLAALKISPRWIGAVMITLIVLYGITSLGCVREEASYTRYSFDQGEITGFGYVLDKAPDGSTLHSDYYTLRFFGRKKINESESLGLPYYTNRLIPGDLNISGSGGYIILPDAQLRRGGLLLGQEAVMAEEDFDPEKGLLPYLPTEENVRNMTGRVSTEDKLYSNRGIEVYYLAR
ncbi:hypothetical protein F8E02_06570 [Methanoculleus sp. Wushi-C6]|uniref:DUF2206 domain-containing protein n=1 Tax=Methanoculleus caldifontis TaxID=2651577 RepID=A0ABU3X0X5_9EURY|nr:hypothetical protein [Methanoculleus sp. Wushi-C6]MDV2481672.1 hypothetical protein [Methanoculleus sp. Wushi-C6]